jgi:hypothetical protein
MPEFALKLIKTDRFKHDPNQGDTVGLSILREKKSDLYIVFLDRLLLVCTL